MHGLIGTRSDVILRGYSPVFDESTLRLGQSSAASTTGSLDGCIDWVAAGKASSGANPSIYCLPFLSASMPIVSHIDAPFEDRGKEACLSGPIVGLKTA
jgi:hypothetical protein